MLTCEIVQAAHLGGEISSLRSQITGREQELKEDYKNVEKRYTAKLIAFKTGEMANRDLELYGKALDKCVLLVRREEGRV